MLETKPDNAVSIIECDMKVRRYSHICYATSNFYYSPSISLSPKVDFAAPVGYQPPEPEKMNTDSAQDAAMDVCKIIVC